MLTAEKLESDFKDAIKEDMGGSYGLPRDITRTINLHQTLALFKIAHELEKLNNNEA